MCIYYKFVGLVYFINKTRPVSYFYLFPCKLRNFLF